MELSTPDRFSWNAAKWIARLGIFLALVTGSVLCMEGAWLGIAGVLVVIFLLFLFQGAAKRQALGWYVDENGERQKVIKTNRDGVIFEPTTRDRRMIEEVEEREKRRREIFWNSLIAIGFTAAVVFFWPSHGQSDVFILFLIPVSLILILEWTVVISSLWAECLYLCGWQDMKGAQVLDPPPIRPGIETVMNQKVHGDIRPPTQAEAIALLKGK